MNQKQTTLPRLQSLSTLCSITSPSVLTGNFPKGCTSFTAVLTRLAERLDVQAQVQSVPARPSKSARSSSKLVEPYPSRGPDSVAEAAGSQLRRSSIEAEAKVNEAIDQIIQHNSTPGLPREQIWAETLSVIKRVTKAYQQVIRRVLEQR